MSFTQVLFNPNGRISQGQFWAGWAVIVVTFVIGTFIPFLGLLVWLGLVYVGICVYGKRLHDMGRSAWLHAIPWALGIGFTVMMFSSMMPLIMELAENPDVEPDPQMVMQQMGPAMKWVLISGLMWIVYTIWVGASRSQPGENEHGPEPGMMGSSDTFT